jgi:hypothetical protein
MIITYFDLMPLPTDIRTSQETEDFARHISMRFTKKFARRLRSAMNNRNFEQMHMEGLWNFWLKTKLWYGYNQNNFQRGYFRNTTEGKLDLIGY